MFYEDWKSLFYTDEEIHELYQLTDGFNDIVNRNSRIRDEKTQFSEYIDKGSDALIRDHSDIVRQLV